MHVVLCMRRYACMIKDTVRIYSLYYLSACYANHGMTNRNAFHMQRRYSAKCGSNQKLVRLSKAKPPKAIQRRCKKCIIVNESIIVFP